MLEDYRKHGLGETSETIADAFASRGLAGATVLELGCGFGALTLELVKRGASSALGVDLSPKMVQLARAMAEESGLAKSVSYAVGDGAAAKLSRSDFVVLDAVLCCYPDVDSLVDNSSSAASQYYAISLPDDARLATRFLRFLLPLQGVLRRGGCRFFIHSTATIKRKLESKGFTLEQRTTAGWIWSVFVFAAPRP